MTIRRLARLLTLALLIGFAAIVAWPGFAPSPEPGPPRWWLAPHPGVVADLYEQDPARARINVMELSTMADWPVHVSRPIRVRKGERLKIDLWAEAKPGREIACALKRGQAPWPSLSEFVVRRVGQTPGRVSFELTASDDEPDARLEFSLDRQVGTLDLWDIRIAPNPK